MALGITVTLDTTRQATVITVTGIPTTAVTYTIARTSPSGNTAGVRGHTQADTNGATTIIARDYEIPLNVPVVYTATVYDNTGAAVGTVTAAAFTVTWTQCESWLVDLARPTNSLTVVIQSLVELAFDFAVGVHRVLNRRAPVLTTLPAWTPSAELIVLTDTLDERDQVRDLLGNGYPFLLRTNPDLGIGNMYLGITGFIEERFLTLGTAPERRFRAQVVQVERPDPTLFVPLAPNTWQHVVDTYTSWADVMANNASWDQLMYSFPAGVEPSPIEPWLPDDI